MVCWKTADRGELDEYANKTRCSTVFIWSRSSLWGGLWKKIGFPDRCDEDSRVCNKVQLYADGEEAEIEAEMPKAKVVMAKKTLKN